jgi:hypothetical protein
MRAVLALGQGLYYVATGVWPLVSMPTFEAVTGPKVDHWLVKTVGVLVTAIGVVLALAGWRRRVEPEPALLAAGSAAGLAAIDTVYATKGRISKIDLLDAVLEIALVVTWALVTGSARRSPRATGARTSRRSRGGSAATAAAPGS